MAFFGFQIYNRAQVNFARTRMGIMHSGHAVFVQNLVKITNVSGLVIDIYGRIFDDRHGFFIAG